MQTQIPYSQLNPSQLREIHDRLAAERAVPPLGRTNIGRVDLVQRIAILRTRPVVAQPVKVDQHGRPARRGTQPIRDETLRLLSRVASYRDRKTGKLYKRRPKGRAVDTVGFNYKTIVQMLRVKFPDCRSTSDGVRWIACMAAARAEGFEKCKLPAIRPRRKDDL